MTSSEDFHSIFAQAALENECSFRWEVWIYILLHTYVCMCMVTQCDMSVERLSASRPLGLISSDVSGRELCALRACKAQKSRKLAAHT